jgi:hypothetical protein
VGDGSGPSFDDSVAAVRVTFDLPAGWSGNGGAIARDAESPAALAMSPWTVGGLYRNPCRPTRNDMQDPPTLASVDGLTGAMISWWRGSDRWVTDDWLPQATGWADGSLAGLAGRYIEITSDRNIAGCTGGRNILWEDQGGRERISAVPGELDRLWILDVSPHVFLSPAVIASGVYGANPKMQVLPLVIDASSQPGASPEDLAELQAIVDSIEIEPVEQADLPSESGRLAYERDGDIYLADPDGSDPTRITEGAGRSSLPEGRSWAPDGRHLLYLEGLPAGYQARISDASGGLVGSFRNDPGFNGYPVWSPDSAHLQAWSSLFTRVSIYGIDGTLQASIPLPDGYARFRENLGAWASDGRSVVVWIEPTTAGTGPEAWQLPVDGSAPRRIAPDELIDTQGAGDRILVEGATRGEWQPRPER